jgi:uncharacterized protein (DUF427 family)
MTNLTKLIPGPSHPIDIDATPELVRVSRGDQVLAESRRALTLREASYPPVHYLPLADVDPEVLVPSSHTSWCPYKGKASYYGLRVGDEVLADAVWTYHQPHDAVAAIADHVAFYPDKVTEDVLAP